MYQHIGFVIFVLSASLIVNASEDLYKVLNINKDATSRELRKAFKKAALEFHPDKNKASVFAYASIDVISADEQLKRIICQFFFASFYMERLMRDIFLCIKR